MLSSTENYPLFQRVIQSDVFGATIMAEYIKNWGYKNVALIYHTDVYSTSFGMNVESELHARDINIVNGPELRVIDTDDPSDITDEIIGPIVSSIWSTNVRTVIVITPYLAGPILERIIANLYDLGARAGDVLFVVNSALNKANTDPLIENVGISVAKLLLGSMEFT